MKHIQTGLRLFLGLIYFVFGLNGFLHFIPAPPLTGPSGDFATAMINTGYFFTMVKAVEVVGGLALLTGMFVPLALVVLAPVTLNIFLFHAFLAPEGMYIQVLLLIIHLILGWYYRSSYREVLKIK
ncbi:MAG: DoxX family membrane protein [Pseudobdellovibrionaceae bacterium]